MEEILRYKVTVAAVVQRVEKAGKEWQRKTSEPNSEMGYTPEIEKTVQREVQLFEQLVTTLDMAALVSVVNGLQIKTGSTPS